MDNQLMVSNKHTIKVLLLLCLMLALGMGQIACSTFCATSGCTGWTRSDCNGVCYNGWRWYSGSNTCDFDPTTDQMAVIDSSDDSGGDAYVEPIAGTSSDTCTVGAPYYGPYLATDSINITSPFGTFLPHYALDFYFNIILQNVNDGSNSKKWEGGLKFTATMSAGNLTEPKEEGLQTNTGGGTTTNPNENSGKVLMSTDICGTGGKKDVFQRLIYREYTHNATGEAIMMTLTNNNAKPDAVWWARVFIFVARLCNQYCLSCFNQSITGCYSCDVSAAYMLSGTTCDTTCLPGYGYTHDPAVCILCYTKCQTCYDLATNCSSCTTSGADQAWLYYNSTLTYSECLTSCPVGYFANDTNHTCDICHLNCTSCEFNDTYCYECTTDFGWYNYNCYLPCPTTFFSDNNTFNCSQCPNQCMVCDNTTSCSVCMTTGNYTSYLLNETCYQNCPDGYYEDDNGGSGPNLCMTCHAACATCTNNPTPCQSCNNGFFQHFNQCLSNCPSSYIAFSPTNQCLLCDTYCVDLTITLSFSDSMNNQLYIDMEFTRTMDFNTFDYQNFQTISITNQNLGNYDITYTLTSSMAYRITLQPKGFAFLYNETVDVVTVLPPATYDTSADTMPFKSSNYQKAADINWFLMKSPQMTSRETSIINGLSQINGAIVDATTVPFIAEVKKSGVFSLLFAGAQLTSSTILINTVPPQNMYQGVRFWATSIFYDAPPWQQISSKPNNFFGSELYNLTKNQRRLFNLNSVYWRFERTGMTSFFMYDVYIPLLMIGTAWLSLLIYTCVKKRRGDGACCKKYQGFFFTVLHKLHEFCMLYVTIAMMLEWLYFDANSIERWISMGICLLFTCYFVGYHLYVYYDMIRYPQAVIGNDQYEYYVLRYSTFLKNIRYQQYDMKESWSVKHWFRPYNYHLLSYYKKFCMMVALPVFYDSKHWQISVLIVIQAMEIARFIATKPYHALWRNVYRFILEIVIFAFFFAILACELLMEQIVKNDPNTINSTVRNYYNIGWFGFAMVWTFNIGFIVLLVIDVVLGCRQSNRQMIEEARRIYYYDKIVEYEKDRDQVPLPLMNKWVKLGNLNDRDQAALPDINVRIQYYKVIKHGGYFDVQILKTVQLYMNTDFNFHQQNNTTTGKQIKKRVKLSKQVSRPLFKLVSQLYQEYAKKDTEAIMIKTFVYVEQREFKAGDRVPLLPESMTQKIELETFSGDKESIRLKKKLQGFPLNPFDLQSI